MWGPDRSLSSPSADKRSRCFLSDDQATWTRGSGSCSPVTPRFREITCPECDLTLTFPGQTCGVYTPLLWPHHQQKTLQVQPSLWEAPTPRALSRGTGQVPLLVTGKARELGPGHTSPGRRGRGHLSQVGSSLGRAGLTTLKPSSHQQLAHWHPSQHTVLCHMPAQFPQNQALHRLAFSHLPVVSFHTLDSLSGCFCITSWPSLLSMGPGSPCFVPVT